MTDIWDAKVYSQFISERTRPAQDLLSVFPADFQPKTICDLGCGPGNSTELLQRYWPNANLIGLDSSTDMLTEARLNHPAIDFIQADIADFSPTTKIDFIVANASLQWLPNHHELIPKLIKLLTPGGAIAIQMPNNFHAPSHQTSIKILDNNPTWRPLLKKLRYGVLNAPFYKTCDYYNLLINHGLIKLQLWETEYFQEMENHVAIFDWIKGTGLRPVLTNMNAGDTKLFAELYIKAIAEQYPQQTNGKVLLPFRRLFITGFIE